MTHIEGDVPEPTEDMDHYVHMHIDYKGLTEDDRVTNEDGSVADIGMGVVHMHIHGVPLQAFVETLLALATQTTATAMLKSDDSPITMLPEGPLRNMMADRLAREFLAAKIKGTDTKTIYMDAAVPDDARELFTDGQ